MSIDDYVEKYNQYKSGNYKFRHFRDEDWAEKFIQKGRIIVFPHSKIEANAMIYTSIIFPIFIFIVFIITSIIHGRFDLMLLMIMMILVGVVTLPFLLGGLYQHKIVFFSILGPEGIVYKERKSDYVDMIYWKDITNIKVSFAKHSVGRSVIDVEVVELHLSNGKEIKMKSSDFGMKEFPKAPREISEEQQRKLFVFVVKKYYEVYKDK